jgi:hypothetical protein
MDRFLFEAIDASVFTSSVEPKSKRLCCQNGPLSGRWIEWNHRA